MRVVFWTRQHFAARQIAAALRALPVELVTANTLEAVLAEIANADVLVSSDCAVEQARQLAPALAASPVRCFQFLSAGRERLSSVGLPDRITYYGIGDSLAPAIGEHGIALALSLYRGLPGSMAAAATGNWPAAHAVPRRGMEGDSALVVGLGAIGRDLARRAKFFGMKVTAVTRTPTPDPNCDEVLPLEAMDSVLRSAGVVFLSLALVPETRALFDAERFNRMRKGAFLVNLARGGLVDQAAMVAALKSGQLGGAGLDVTDPEPLPAGDPLWTAPNVVITPHVAVAGSTLSGDRLAANVARNIAVFMRENGGREG